LLSEATLFLRPRPAHGPHSRSNLVSGDADRQELLALVHNVAGASGRPQPGTQARRTGRYTDAHGLSVSYYQEGVRLVKGTAVRHHWGARRVALDQLRSWAACATIRNDSHAKTCMTRTAHQTNCPWSAAAQPGGLALVGVSSPEWCNTCMKLDACVKW
jgi:hypothetical protein